MVKDRNRNQVGMIYAKTKKSGTTEERNGHDRSGFANVNAHRRLVRGVFATRKATGKALKAS